MPGSNGDKIKLSLLREGGRLRALTSFLFCALLFLTLTGCGEQVCSFCGQEKICKEFDILGTTRLICEDCLHNPAIAVSGNVVREYSALFENGTLEYPEGSPMRADYVAPEPSGTEAPATEPLPETQIITTTAASEEQPAGSTQEAPASVPTVVADAPAPETPADTAPAAAPASDSQERAPQSEPGASALNAEPLIRDLNRLFQPDGYRLAQDNDVDGAYRLLLGDTDLHILFLPRETAAADKYELTIASYDGASSSDFVKAVIRAILSYIDSSDYDGLGHDIYNSTIQNGSYVYEGINFSVVQHTAEEIERGSAETEFLIRP